MDGPLEFEAFVERAGRVPIEDEVARRGIKLRGTTERCGPCPKCGGKDRFSINTAKQVWNCRGCKPPEIKGDIVGLVMHLDSTHFLRACETLTNEAPPDHPGGESRREQPRQPVIQKPAALGSPD